MSAATGEHPAALSLDLDDLWTYMRARGDQRWAAYPSFLHIAIPRIIEFLDRERLRGTVFVVGRDAASPATRELVGEVARAGHEIANHSFDHRIDFHKATPAQVNADLERAEQALEGICGIKPRGFRGPSYRLSGAILDALVARDYVYDTSTFPTFVGPLARAYHFRRAMLEGEERRRQEDLFGRFRDGLRPLSVYRWQLECGKLIEVPVTTLHCCGHRCT